MYDIKVAQLLGLKFISGVTELLKTEYMDNSDLLQHPEVKLISCDLQEGERILGVLLKTDGEKTE